MPADPNKLSQFWRELKRRKVIKVIAMYAGAAYVLIELTNNIAGLRIPSKPQVTSGKHGNWILSD
jgi:hypothetical protein